MDLPLTTEWPWGGNLPFWIWVSSFKRDLKRKIIWKEKILCLTCNISVSVSFAQALRHSYVLERLPGLPFLGSMLLLNSLSMYIKLSLYLWYFCLWYIFRIKLICPKQIIDYSVSFTSDDILTLCSYDPPPFYYFLNSPSKISIWFLSFPLISRPTAQTVHVICKCEIEAPWLTTSTFKTECIC